MERVPKQKKEAINNRGLRDRVGRFIGRPGGRLLLAAGVGLAAGVAALTVGHGSGEAPKTHPGNAAHGNLVPVPSSLVNLPRHLPDLPEFPTPGAQEIDGKEFISPHGAFAVERVDPIINGKAVQDPSTVVLQYRGSTWQVVEGPGLVQPDPVFPDALNQYLTQPEPLPPNPPPPAGTPPHGGYAPGGD